MIIHSAPTTLFTCSNGNAVVSFEKKSKGILSRSLYHSVNCTQLVSTSQVRICSETRISRTDLICIGVRVLLDCIEKECNSLSTNIDTRTILKAIINCEYSYDLIYHTDINSLQFCDWFGCIIPSLIGIREYMTAWSSHDDVIERTRFPCYLLFVRESTS